MVKEGDIYEAALHTLEGKYMSATDDLQEREAKIAKERENLDGEIQLKDSVQNKLDKKKKMVECLQNENEALLGDSGSKNEAGQVLNNEKTSKNETVAVQKILK